VAITPVTDTSVSKIPGVQGPGIKLHWTYTRASEPNYWCLRVDGKEVNSRINPDNTRIGTSGGTATHELSYWALEGFTRHKVVVDALNVGVGGGQSRGNLRHYVTPRPVGIWLVDQSRDTAVQIRGTDSPDMSFREVGTTYDLIGGKVPKRIIDTVGGYSGSVTGFVLGPTARSRFKELKGRSRTKELRLVFSDLNIKVRLEEAAISPTPMPLGQRQFAVSFNFFQSDDVGFKAGSH